MLSNPFSQSPAYYILRFTLTQDLALLADGYFADNALSVSVTEIPQTPHLWQVEVLYTHKPEAWEIQRRMEVLAELHAIAPPAYTLEQLESRNWLEAVKQDFPPLHIGRFYIYGSHVTQSVPFGSVGLQIDAGLAFGSGEHATTSGCLLALERLAKRTRLHTILDVGTGSGILAMAAAKIMPHARVIAADIDPVAVRVARDNVQRNRLYGRVHSCVAAGYNATLIRKNAPYDLIFANILARPLMHLATDLAAHLKNNGRAVLSGLLKTQENMVLSAHRQAGLSLHSRITIKEWSTLILTRSRCN